MYFAIEIRLDRIHISWLKKKMKYITNLRFLYGEASYILSHLQANVFSTIYINYPDPPIEMNNKQQLINFFY